MTIVPHPLAVPKLKKIILNVGLGEALTKKEVLEKVSGQIAQICGQKPKITRAKKSIAGFKLSAGDPIGLAVTLRRKRMLAFLKKLVAIVLPRIRDFKGLSVRGFDGQGNYTLGIREQIVFPEIDYTQVDKARGMEITIVTTAKNNEEGKKLLEIWGMPFGMV